MDHQVFLKRKVKILGMMLVRDEGGKSIIAHKIPYIPNIEPHQ